MTYMLLALSLVGSTTAATLNDLDWLIGQWRSEFDGKVRWPTIPTMTYGEVVTVAKAPRAIDGPQLYNWTATSWAHSTKDHLHDEWGYIGIGSDGKAVLMTSGNNGFNKIEEGDAQDGYLDLVLSKIARVSFTRDLPVHDLRRTLRRLPDDRMEQILRMRTENDPRGDGTLEHSRIIYRKLY